MIHFASFQSDVGRRLCNSFGLNADEPDTFAFIIGDRIFTESDAMIEVAIHMGGIWTSARILRIIPRKIRDKCYRFVAKNRYKWFGTQRACSVPSEDIAKRFIH
jgi:predicted DCC family thiol-disulfide oxidoreductase YuxK